MTDLTYEIILYWDNRDQIYVAEVPELAGCMAHGSTRAEAVKSAEEAIRVWIRTAKLDGADIPLPGLSNTHTRQIR